MSITSRDAPTSIPAAPAYDPECAAALEELPRFPALTADLIPDIREGNRSLQRSNEELSAGADYLVEDHLASDAEGVLVPILICRPTLPTVGVPALYYIHGGGLIAGSPRDALDTVLDLAAEIGAVVIAVDYRLAPEAPFPAGLNDCVTGLSWSFEHADELGIDPDRVIVLGGSAGGGLGAALSVLWRDRALPPLAGQLLMSPMLDNRNDSVSAHQMAERRMWTRNDNAVGWTAYLGADHLTTEPPRYAVPARTAQYTDLPPTFIDVGSADTFRDEDVAFANAIWAAGGHAELHVWPGGFHGYDGIAPHARISLATIAARKDWLRRIAHFSQGRHAPHPPPTRGHLLTDWTARFIAPDLDFDGAPLLRRTFDLQQDHTQIAAATLTVSALGIVTASLNGQVISEDLFTPGWTAYQWRLRYATYDVRALLASNTSTLGLALGNGWYRGRLGWADGAEVYGPELAGFAELRITYLDGTQQLLTTDGSWKAGPSSTIANSLYDGQTIDARLDTPNWNTGPFDDTAWVGVHELDVDLNLLEPYLSPPVRRITQLPPVRIWTSPRGRTLIDFGQNLVGWLRLRVQGPAGAMITIRHSEVLEHDELGTRPLRTAQATDRFILSGGLDTFEPTLTFHGFRYAEIDGWPGGIDAINSDAVTAVVVSSDLRPIGRFTSSNEQVNRLHENVVWGMRGNFLDVPTDCPQRDERLGWTGDIAAFAPTAVFLADASGFLRDWLRDLALEQADQGFVPFVVPDTIRRMSEPPPFQPVDATAIWSDAAVWVPWAVWQAYGDDTVLRDQYASITGHVRHVATLLSPSGRWEAGFQFGDWLDPDAPADRADKAKADKSVVATASIYRSTVLAAETARILGHDADAHEFEDLAAHIRTGFRDGYVADQRVHSDATTAYTLAIVFGLLNDDELGWAGDRLAQLVDASGYRISTGFAGTPFITDALTSTGHVETAYRLLLQTENPSWLYPVTMGATTIWERWDSMLPDGTINPGSMTSFNHYALGAVADWLHRVVGGIAPLEAGYRRVLIAPTPGPGIDWAETSLETPHGHVAVSWTLLDGKFRVAVDLPATVEGVLRLPDGTERTLGSGSHEVTTQLVS